ncbi:MAG: ribonuclease P protein component [Cyclobacteriaceae bacterium]|nr:ribonuclease P protein component [Cyclobacteriaceae bacterium]
MGNSRFPKKERLSRKKIIEDLFNTGSSQVCFPLKVMFAPHPDAKLSSHQVLISAPVKNFKNAVDRNTIKRRIREGYRQHKHTLTTSRPLCLAYIYIAKEILPSKTIHQAILTSLERIRKHEKKD